MLPSRIVFVTQCAVVDVRLAWHYIHMLPWGYNCCTCSPLHPALLPVQLLTPWVIHRAFKKHHVVFLITPPPFISLFVFLSTHLLQVLSGGKGKKVWSASLPDSAAGKQLLISGVDKGAAVLVLAYAER